MGSSSSKLCLQLSGMEKRVLSGLSLYTYPQEGKHLILLLAQVSLAQRRLSREHGPLRGVRYWESHLQTP